MSMPGIVERTRSDRKSLFVAMLLALALSSMPAIAANHDVNKVQMSKNYGNIPLHFEANQGQTDEQVRFISRGSGYTMYLTPKEAVLVLAKSKKHKKEAIDATGDPDISNSVDDNEKQSKPINEKPNSAVLRMKLVGAETEPAAAGLDELPGKVNYFIGNDSSKWRKNISTYSKVKFKDVYKGIDLVYYGTSQHQLEYDFVVSPGADLSAITFAFEGADKSEVDADGNLVIHLPVQDDENANQVAFRKPLVYQEIDGIRREIQSSYYFKNDHQLGFKVAGYDNTKPLIIDPVLVYSTYLGGDYKDIGEDIAVDSFGAAFVVGYTASANFPIANALQVTYGGSNSDVFVSKLNPAGTGFIFSTYLGGNNLEFWEPAGGRGVSVALDTDGYAYVTGYTRSSNFPITANAFQTAPKGGGDAFVTKLNPNGSELVYSTYLGGSNWDNGPLSGVGIAVDASGNAYVTGITRSTDFPTTDMAFQKAHSGGVHDCFVTKLNRDGSGLLYSTYLGGSGDNSPSDYCSAIAIDTVGNAYVTGRTMSLNFPIANAFQPAHGGGGGDAFVTKLNPDGSGLVYSTYLGGSSNDQGFGIAVDALGNAYVTGLTSSTDFHTINAYQMTLRGTSDSFVTKLNHTGAILYSTYLGGSGVEGVSFFIVGDIAVDISGNAYVTGATSSPDFTTIDASQTVLLGLRDAFVAKLNLNGAVVYSTYLGGSGGDFGVGIALDNSGNIYVTGGTTSSDFPTANASQNQFTSWRGDAFVVKIGDIVTIAPPSLLTATDTPCDNGGSVTLTWSKSVDDGAGLNNVISYNVYRSASSGGPFGKIGNVVAGAISFVDGSAVSGTSYYYVVRASDGSKESSDSNSASASSARNLPLPPASVITIDTPYDLGGSITLNWTKSSDDGAGLNNVSGYNIYRYSSTNGSIVSISSVSAGTTSYIDNTTMDGDTYYYLIMALNNQCGMESLSSNTASGQSVNNFTAMPGYISTLPGISAQTVNSLTSKIENAIASFESGNTTVAVNKLNALLNEISAQSGKGIDASTAQTLASYVQNLIAYINAH